MSTEAEEAYKEAEKRIAEAKAANSTHLELHIPGLEVVPPSIAELSGLWSLDLGRTSVSDLAPLSSLTALTLLYLSDTSVSDLAPLASLTGLIHLDLSGASVSDLEPLASLTGLGSLDLSGAPVSDFGPLASLTGLQSLSLWDTSVSDLGPLASLTELKALGLSRTSVSDLAPLAYLIELESLHLSSTSVSDLGPLASLTELETLHLQGTSVSNLAPLASLTELKTLNLWDTSVSDLAPLASLTELETLHLQGSNVADLRPIKGNEALATEYESLLSGLQFQNTPATKLDPKLHELSLIEDSKDRTRQTLDYLNTLGDDWPPGSAVAEDRPGAPAYTMPEDGGPVRALEEAPDGWDEAQHILLEQVRQKAGWLIDAISPDSNQHARLRQVAVHYLDNVSSAPEEIGLSALWSSGNTLRQEWKIHQKAEQQGYPEDELPPRIAGMLEDLVTTHGAFVMGFPNAQALEYRQRDYVSSATTSADRATVEVAMNELNKSIQAEQGIVDQQTRNALSDDHLAASREGPDADMARNSLRDRLWNIVGAVGRGLWVGMKVVSTGVAGNIITEFVLANAAKIQAFLSAVNDIAAWWFPHLVTALRAFVGV